MADFDSRHQVFIAISRRIDSRNKLLIGFWQYFDIAIVQEDVTGERAVHNEHHKALCQASSITELTGVTRSKVLSWVMHDRYGLYDWVAYEAKSEGVNVQEWFAERGVANEFEDLVRYSMGDTTVDIDEVREEIGLCVADEFLRLYQEQSHRKGAYDAD